MQTKLKFCCSLFLACFLCTNSSFAADERFTVDINVDVTGANASAAREKAMREANRAAVVAVSKRVSNTEGTAKISTMTDNQLVNFVKEVTVVEEKTSAVRYMAHLRVVTNEDMLKEYMKERDIAVNLTEQQKILMIPIFHEFSNDKPQLWESTNIWKQAWDNAASTTNVRFVSIPANGFNYTAIDGAQAQAQNGEALSKVINANGASDAYVLDASYDGIEGLLIRATSYNGDTQTIRVAGSRSSGTELFSRAVEEVKKQLEGKIAAQTIQENSLENTAVVLYSFPRLQEWTSAERALSNTPSISTVELQAFASNSAQLRLTYTGSEEKLIKMLNRQGYTLQNQGKYFTMEKY